MSDTSAILRTKIDGADKLKSVVRTMKAMAASSIGQYENAVLALADYELTVTLGLTACLRQMEAQPISKTQHAKQSSIGAIVFGSDQGLVGQFNEIMATFVAATLDRRTEQKKIWVIGERLYSRLADAGFPLAGPYPVPNSVEAIAQLVGQIQIECEAQNPLSDAMQVLVFHNQPQAGSLYQPVCRQLLPLDAAWQHALAKAPWPGNSIPQAVGINHALLRNLISEYLFMSIFKACAESLDSENASRLAAMQRAEKNIDELSSQLHRTFSRLRQNAIDEELFDVIAGFNALSDGPS